MLFRDDLDVEVDRLSKSVALLSVGLQMHIRPAFQTFKSQQKTKKRPKKRWGEKKEICCVAHHFISDVTLQMKATLSRNKAAMQMRDIDITGLPARGTHAQQ